MLFHGAEKKKNLGQSYFILNKLLVDEHYYGQLNERLSKQVNIWREKFTHQAQQWDENNIDIRAKLFLKLFEDDISSSFNGF